MLSPHRQPLVYEPPMEPYLDVRHRDDQVLVLHKPSGLLSVPGKAAELADCLEARAKAEYPEALLVHRLDMDTSGVFVMAMNKAAQRNLGLQFERRKTAKHYVALVHGIMEDDSGLVDEPLRCDWPNRPKQMICYEHGKPSQTRFEVLERNEATNRTRVKLTPVTGRSHQLRVHMLHLGHPILGDDLYAHDDAYEAADRLMLHAEMLGFHHPDGGTFVEFTAACPF